MKRALVGIGLLALVCRMLMGAGGHFVPPDYQIITDPKIRAHVVIEPSLRAKGTLAGSGSIFLRNETNGRFASQSFNYAGTSNMLSGANWSTRGFST